MKEGEGGVGANPQKDKHDHRATKEQVNHDHHKNSETGGWWRRSGNGDTPTHITTFVTLTIPYRRYGRAHGCVYVDVSVCAHNMYIYIYIYIYICRWT
jgi:hypothetical protein